MAIDRVLLYVKVVVFMIVISGLGLLVKALVTNGYWWIAITFPFLAYLMCGAVGCDQPSSAEGSEQS